MQYRYSRLVTELPTPQLAAYIRAELERQRYGDRRHIDPVPTDDTGRQQVLASIPMPTELMIE